jgi:hypothetical protein
MMMLEESGAWRIGQPAFVSIENLKLCGHIANTGDTTLGLAIPEPAGDGDVDVPSAVMTGLEWRALPADGTDVDLRAALRTVTKSQATRSRPLRWSEIKRFSCTPSLAALAELGADAVLTNFDQLPALLASLS